MGSNESKLNPQDMKELQKSTKYNAEEIKDWYRGFVEDFPDGYLTIEQFKDIYQNFYPNGNASAFADNTFRAFDHNKDGSIDFREFMTGLSMSSKGSYDEKMQWIFQLYDTNNNGLISKEEMGTIIQAIHQMCKCDDEEDAATRHVEKLYQSADANGDGQLSYDEFVALAKSDPTIANVLTGDMAEY